jgi:hypothetical protein
MSEQLQELSKDTLKSYKKKAEASSVEHAAASRKHGNEYEKKAADGDHVGAGESALKSAQHQLKSLKRQVGVMHAKSKLGEEMSLLEALLNEDFVALREALDERLQEVAMERIDELSKGTLKSYTKKANTSAERAWKKADKEEDKAMSTDGEKYPEKAERHQKAASAAIGTWKKRQDGIKAAAKRLKKD